MLSWEQLKNIFLKKYFPLVNKLFRKNPQSTIKVDKEQAKFPNKKSQIQSAIAASSNKKKNFKQL